MLGGSCQRFDNSISFETADGHLLIFCLSLDRYNVIFMFLTYFLPIGLMSYTYARVGSELWGSQSIGECTQRQLENIKSKRRVSVCRGETLDGVGSSDQD